MSYVPAFRSIEVEWRDEIENRNFTMEMAVNREYEGLFARRSDGTWGQWLGTGEFRATTPRQMIRKMKAQYQEDGIQTLRMVPGSADGWEE